MTSKYNFAWGDPVGIRQVLVSIYPELKLPWFNPEDIGYGQHHGDDALISAIRHNLKQDYTHILITAGCSQAIQAGLYALKSDIHTKVRTRSLYFPFYPKMIEVSGLTRNTRTEDPTDILLWDVPSNPLGMVNFPLEINPTILDLSYMSDTYLSKPIATPKADIAVGSLGKLTGLTGLRLGFLATDSDSLYLKAYDRVCFDTIGAPMVGQKAIAKVLADQDRWIFFTARSKAMVDSNRYELSRLSYLFDGQEVSENGMFAFFSSSPRVGRIFEKASVAWTSGLDCGADYYSMRFNLSRANVETKGMVSAVLKADGK